MIKRFVYMSSFTKMSTNFHSQEGTICGVNIKAFKEKEKTVKRDGVPVVRRITTWGLFLHIKMENGDQYDAIWKINKTFTEGHNKIPQCKPLSRKASYFVEPAIAKVFRACGVKEWVELIGTKIRVKPTGRSLDIHDGFGISPIDEQSGCWFYPEFYEIHDGGVTHEQ